MLSCDRNMRVAQLIEPWQIVIFAHRHLIIIGIAVLIKKCIGCELACLISFAYQVMNRSKPCPQFLQVNRSEALEPRWFPLIDKLDRSEIYHKLLHLVYSLDGKCIHLWSGRDTFSHYHRCRRLTLFDYLASSVGLQHLANFVLLPELCSFKESPAALGVNEVNADQSLFWCHLV